MNIVITPGLDVALLTFYAFVLFFIGLVFYLRREDRREGYPLEDEFTGRLDTPGGPLSAATPKMFRLPHGHGVVYAPPRTPREPVDIAARRTDRFAGAPYAPTGNPLTDGVGPAAYANRAKRPDVDMEGHARIVPMANTNSAIWVAKGDPDLIGWPVIGADGKQAGTVTDLWVDRAERVVRYIEVDTGTGRALAPMPMASVEKGRRRVVVDAINAADFAGAPFPATPGEITLYEEERVVGYFGGGYLYANTNRQEPFL